MSADTDTGPRAVPPPPPPTRPPAPKPAPRNGSRSLPIRRIEDGVTRLAQGVAGGIAMTGNVEASEIWRLGAPQFGQAWAGVAEVNDQVRKTLTTLLEGGAWGAAITSSLALLAPLIVPYLPVNSMTKMTAGQLPFILGVVDVDAYNARMTELHRNGSGGSAKR